MDIKEIIYFIVLVIVIIGIAILIKLMKKRKEQRREERRKEELEKSHKKWEEERLKKEEENKLRRHEQAKKEHEEYVLKEKERREKSSKFIDKYNDWFYSEEGLKALAVCTEPQSYLLQESVYKQYLDRIQFAGYNDDLDPYDLMMNSEEYIPYAYFFGFIDSVFEKVYDRKGENQVGKFKIFIARCLNEQANTIYFDGDGEPKIKKPIYNSPEILDFNKNPILVYLRNYVFKMSASSIEKQYLIPEIVGFLLNETFEKESDKSDIIAKNQWIFHYSTYKNELGTIRTITSFYKIGMQSSSNPKYFENKLKDKLNQ